jgi:dihydrodipicolinate synthase/N-acetylneuraminate lyase
MSPKIDPVAEQAAEETITIPKAVLEGWIAEKKELAADMQKLIAGVLIIHQTMDLKNPMKALMSIQKMITKPDAFKALLAPISEVLEKYHPTV